MASDNLSEELANQARAAQAHAAAVEYFWRGLHALQYRELEDAERMLRTAARIFEKYGSEEQAAAYHNLGVVAEQRGEFDAAVEWFNKSLRVKEQVGDAASAAMTYHHLGRVAMYQHRFAVAEDRYHEARQIFERLGDQHRAGMVYQHLGAVMVATQNFDAAEQWLRRALAIQEPEHDNIGAAYTYMHFGDIAGARRRYVEAGQWLISALLVLGPQGDPEAVHLAAGRFVQLREEAGLEERAEMNEAWQTAGLPLLKAVS